MRKSSAVLIAAVLFLGMAKAASADTISLLKAYYAFNGNANDASGHGYDGVVSGAVLTQDRFGNTGSAYSFDGIDDYVRLALLDSYSPGELTLSAWIKSDVFDHRQMIIDKLDGFDTSGNLALEIRGPNQIVMQLNKEGGWHETLGSTPIAANSWYQVSATYDSSYLRVFLNGEQVGETGYTGGFGVNTLPWMIGVHAGCGGGDSFCNGFSFDGAIDDVRIYDRALSAADIGELYNESSQVPEPGTTLLLLGTGLAAVAALRRFTTRT